MGKKKPLEKPRAYKPGKYQYLVFPDRPVVRIGESGYRNLPVEILPRTLHSKGGLIKGKPKLAKKGWN